MIKRRCFVLVVAAGLASTLRAQAQQPATAIVESEGAAKIAIAPEQLYFEFSKSFDGPTLIDAAAQANAFEKALTQALGDLDSTPTRHDPLRLRVPGGTKPLLKAFIRVTFPMPESNGSLDAPTKTAPLAELAEKIRKAGVSLMAEARFAGFDLSDRETSEQDAIARAAENALYHAEAVGALLEGRVIGAERITILETRWEGLDAAEGTLPIPPVVECHARVRISYQYSSPAR